MERALVEPHGIAFRAIDFSGLRGKGLKTLVLGGFLLLRAMWQSRKIMRSDKPDAVFSTGGYVAVPAGMAASSLGVPLVLLNAGRGAADVDDVAAGRSRPACLCGFDGEAAQKAGAKGLVTGNPVRAEIAAVPAPAERYRRPRPGALRLLVIGGSLGAQVLNETVPQALALHPGGTAAAGGPPVRREASRRGARRLREGGRAGGDRHLHRRHGGALRARPISCSRARAPSP